MILPECVLTDWSVILLSQFEHLLIFREEDVSAFTIVGCLRVALRFGFDMADERVICKFRCPHEKRVRNFLVSKSIDGI